jgi:hypothetical protein
MAKPGKNLSKTSHITGNWLSLFSIIFQVVLQSNTCNSSTHSENLKKEWQNLKED